MKTPLVVSAFLDRARTLYHSAVGVVCGGDRFTYGEFGARADRLSSALANLGVRRDEVVACLSFNCHRLLEAYFALPQMGAILLPVNIRLLPEDIFFILSDAGASTVLADRALMPLLEPIRDRLPALRTVVLMGGDTTAQRCSADPDYEALIAAAPATFARPKVDEDTVAELFYTSGTTARPKGVMLSHRNLYTHAMSVAVALRTSDSDVQLHSIPLFHVNGWGTPHTLTMVGGRHVMLPKFDPEQVLETIERERITLMLLVPTMAVALLNARSAADRDLSSLKRVMLGGAASPPSLIKLLDDRLPGCAVMSGYGLSETSPVLTTACVQSHLSLDASESVRLRSTAGVPLPGVEIEIFDDAGTTLLHDGKAVGEICVRANSVMVGYWHQPEETAKVMHDGWFHTGDVGSIDAHGYVTIVDRIKDIIITGGENVSSIEIEKAIYEYPGVLECAVVAVADPRWGEVPAALIVLKPGTSTSERDILAHCVARLAGFKMPKRVKFVDGLPKGGTGKILKRELRDLYGPELALA